MTIPIGVQWFLVSGIAPWVVAVIGTALLLLCPMAAGAWQDLAQWARERRQRRAEAHLVEMVRRGRTGV